jgi:3D-(3,5/4)-trihydroxycyclohexane-1,2-dione acylhydrolase (decyclizing)
VAIAASPGPDPFELEAAATLLRGGEKPLIVAGGGVLYSNASAGLAAFARAHGIPVAETQAGKSSCRDHPLNMGAVGVTGTAAANTLAARPTWCWRRHAAAGFHHRLAALFKGRG